MKRADIEYKLRQIWLPVLLLSIAFAAVYSLLNWLLVAGTGLLPLDEDVAGLWLPGCAGWILCAALMTRRLRTLKLSEARNVPTLYGFAAAAVVAVPAMIAQGYVRTATGDITHVRSASSIASAPGTRYYAADFVCLARTQAVAEPVFETSGRSNQTLTFNLYYLVPVCADGEPAAARQPVWIGFKYQKSVRNSLSDSAKRIEYDRFEQDCNRAIRDADPARFRYYERVGVNADRRGFEQALRQARLTDQSAGIMLVPHTEEFNERTGNRLAWVFRTLAIGAFTWLVLALIPAVHHDRHGQPAVPAKRRNADDGRDALQLFLPSRQSYGLQTLVGVNALVFVAMALSGLGVMSFRSDDLLAWGANYGPAIHGSGVLRLLSSQFVHGGLMHLLNNLYGLAFAAMFLAPVVTNWRLIACYLICGLGGSLASVTVHPTIVSIGASGAIFGLCGMLLTLLLLRDARLGVSRLLILANVGFFVALNLFLGAVSPGIDNAAHVGGLATGIGLGIAVYLAGRATARSAAAGGPARSVDDRGSPARE